MKDWLLNVALTKMGPSAIRAALATLVALILAHQGVLAKFGIVYDSANQVLSLHLSTLQEWLDVTGIGLLTAVIMGIQHHTTAAIKGTPQTGA